MIENEMQKGQTWRGDGKGRNEEQDRMKTLMFILFRVFHKTKPTKNWSRLILPSQEQ